MRASLILKTSKTSPKALTAHEKLLSKGGFIQKICAGIYQFLPLGFIVYRRIYKIIEEELEKIGFLSFLGPMVQPAELWKATKRYETFGEELLRFENRKGEEMVLAPTHEENVGLAAKFLLRSYKDLPLLLNQVQPKYRDEPRSRGGLIRLREFIMQDGYSFHKDKEDLDLFYEKVRDAYSRIFERVGLNPIIVKSATGSMGGKEAEEFMVVADIGEDKVVLCSHCHYAANLEVGRFKNIFIKEKPKKSKLVKTPNITSIDELSEFLDIDPHRLAKIVFFENEKKELIVGVVLGDREINERKLSLVTNSLTLLPADSSLIKRKGFEPGFAKPEILKDKVKIVVDEEVWKSNNLITGSNKKDYHLINFNPKKDIKGKVIVGDIAEAREGDLCPLCESKLRIERAIEVGNIFKLGDKYSKDFGISFFDERGKKFYPEEGCYGIGLDRLMATVVEIHHDEKGIIWPQEIAPFDYHFIYLGDKNKKKAEFIYKKLEEKGKRVLFDDRDNSPGEKFADADLIGCPKRILISDKTLKENKIEVKDRKSGKIFILDIESFLEQDV